ncbi:hypothetical protein [Acinetobacter sp.]|uniref:hypothetical protein n=1 Tax=Acinetobacter sp. TaxID=472 RepID=UPI003751EE19
MQKEIAEQTIQQIPQEKIQIYKDYWNKITPKDNEEYFWRWIFAFLSVHTTWNSNVRSYLLLREHRELWRDNKNELARLIRESGVGLHVRRTEGIWKFNQSYLNDSASWKKNTLESWIGCRDRLAERCFGLGYAKTAFALEMCYPTENASVCLDTHMLQLYGFTTESARRKATQYNKYKEIENHWIEECNKREVPAYIARCLFWDEKQRKDDSRYWSYVLE